MIGEKSTVPGLERIDIVKAALERNGFEVYPCGSAADARNVFANAILPSLRPASASYGDSETLLATKILDDIKADKSIQFIETFDMRQTGKERINARKEALTVDLFLGGANAVTEKGQLVNLDMTGNRIAGTVFGPRNVVLAIGKNKIVKDIEEGMKRVKECCAPGNVRRHPEFDTPCRKTGYCVDCGSDQRICNIWSIIEKCYPKKRIKILLIDENLGL